MTAACPRARRARPFATRRGPGAADGRADPSPSPASVRVLARALASAALACAVLAGPPALGQGAGVTPAVTPTVLPTGNGPLFGGDPATPLFDWRVKARLDDKWTFFSQDATGELNDLYPYIKLYGGLNLTDQLSLQAEVRAKPVIPPTQSRVFQDVGVYFHKLYGQAEIGAVTARAGIVTIPFGKAWKLDPGIFGKQFADGIETQEVSGAYISMPAPFLSARSDFTAGVFWDDVSGLSNSLITRRGRTRYEDGGAANTQAPNNFAVTLTEDLGPFQLSGGYRLRSPGKGDTRTESGFYGTAVWQTPIATDWTFWALGEYAYLINADANPGDELLTTVSAMISHDRWAFSGLWNIRDEFGIERDQFASANLKYALSKRLSAQLAYAWFYTGGQRKDMLAMRLQYDFGGRWR